MEESPFEARAFCLVDGYRDTDGRVHREGAMRLASAGEEAATLRDFRVYLRPESFLVLMLARTIVRLGAQSAVDVEGLQRLSARDLHRLAALYRQLNGYAAVGGEA